MIDELLAEGETASVLLRRTLQLDSVSDRAEFIKDVLGLVNTQTTGRRLILVGFDSRTRGYHAPPDPRVTQNRLDQLLSQYTEPVVLARYEVVDYQTGPVATLELLRESTKLPYRVRKSLRGETRRIRGIVAGDFFVRHGTRTEHPSAEELAALREEGALAREAH